MLIKITKRKVKMIEQHMIRTMINEWSQMNGKQTPATICDVASKVP